MGFDNTQAASKEKVEGQATAPFEFVISAGWNPIYPSENKKAEQIKPKPAERTKPSDAARSKPGQPLNILPRL